MSTSSSNRGPSDDRTPPSGSVPAVDRLDTARACALRAEHSPHESLQAWLDCAVEAYRALDTEDGAQAQAAMALANRGTAEVLARLLQHTGGWQPGPINVADAPLQIEFREVSTHLRPPLRIRRAQDVSMHALDGRRHARTGFGVPVAALSSGWQEGALDCLAPRSGVFRNLTAWIEPDARQDDAPPHLVLADPQRLGAVAVGPHRYELARDTSAGYAWAMELSGLERSGLWGLIGGTKIGRRAGLYLLEDYAPDKRPLVMIHGLGSNPLTWAHLSNAIWGEEDLRAKFQIWQVVHQTDAPLLVARLRVQQYLDEAWRVLDPGGEAKGRAGTVLVGHSLGGVVARLLCAHSGDTLWNAAFLVPPQALDASAEDLEMVRQIFSFQPYPGIARAIFVAAPHRGSPSAATLLGRFTRELVGRRAVEVHALRRIAIANPSAIRPEMRAIFQEGWINSISTLQAGQPVRRATEALLPPAGLPYHTIAGVRPGRREQTDGVVPLDSAMLPGAESSLVVGSGHRVHENPRAIEEVLRILRQ